MPGFGTTLPTEREVQIPMGDDSLYGTLTLPSPAQGLVVFAHGSGSSRHSPRNRSVAAVLQQAGLGTLLFDLLTATEEQLDARTGHLRFNIDFLARRLLAVTDWLAADPSTASLPIGYFGASTGAAAALVAAAQRPGIRAIVSRGGRPDLAEPFLGQVEGAVLLIVGSRDYGVIELNRDALARLTRARPKELVIIPGATHLFEEPGALDQVARRAADWFVRHLAPAASAAIR